MLGFITHTLLMSAVTTKPVNLNFPLTAVVGVEAIKLALLLAAIDPQLGGVGR